MILSDYWIRYAVETGDLEVKPHPADQAFQPASLELRIQDDLVLAPGQCRLATTVEWVRLAPTLRGQVSGKSGVGRLFTAVHVTAGFIDPGFEGQITLEMVNHQQVESFSPAMRRLERTAKTVRFTAGQYVAQLELAKVMAPMLRPYGHPELGSHYQGQTGVVGSYLEVAVEEV